MPKLQEAKKGGFFIFLKSAVVRAMGWKKGDNLEATVFRRGAILVAKDKWKGLK